MDATQDLGRRAEDSIGWRALHRIEMHEEVCKVHQANINHRLDRIEAMMIKGMVAIVCGLGAILMAVLFA